ncbi:MAG: aminotransferase class I/II-fold pyridoxal phosphate-dependent enzyme [bacterium]|nr:aminotransferase class I/II-fold pyridoxal phosphate-dependent enzyme [bacterium]
MKNIKSKNKTKFIPTQSRIHYGGAVIDNREIKALLETIETGGGFNWTIGKKGEEFENILSDYTKQKYTILTNSGSSSLLIGLLALHLPKGSKVVLPATTFPTAYSSIIYAGYEPLVIDSKIETFNIDEKELEKAFRKFKNIKAVIAVNIAGNIPNLKKIREITKKHDAKLILDNCDGFGGRYNNHPVESLADVVATSFHAAHIITMGEGGAVFTSDPEVANRARQYRDWGREGGDDKPTKLKGLPSDYPKRYSYPVLGLNLKPLELQAAVGIVQFKKLNKFMAIRSRNFKLLNKIFSKYPDHFRVMETERGAEPCWFSFPILVTGLPRKTLVDCLEKNNIETRPIFSGNILRHPIGKCDSLGNCPNADKILEKGLFVGLSPRTTPEMIRFVGKVIDGLIQKA